MLYSSILFQKGEIRTMKDIMIDKRETKNGLSYQYRFEIVSVNGKRKFDYI